MIPRYLINFDLKEMEKKKTDVLVVGSGMAGLISALNLSSKKEVTLLSKEGLKYCNTEYAQGGIAAVIAKDDSTALHTQDTLEAGAGLCNFEAVNILASEGSEEIKELIDLEVPFDREGEELSLTKEGAHSCRRILHAGGDATGKEIRNTLINNLLSKPKIKIKEDIFVIDLLRDDDRCFGALIYDKKRDKHLAYLAEAVILATGGAGQLYTQSSNPKVATGDGIALAYRAGVEVMDLEFIQFHPTTLSIEGSDNFLISEAVRGEGATLRNEAGERFMPSYHPLAELAPRDVVARAIYREIMGQKNDYVYLDLSRMEQEFIKKRFPTIYRNCLKVGLDISESYIPVAPAAHYLMGGIKVNTQGETNLKGLFACGEVACTGVHGANRLASNSLLEGLVFAKRVAKEVNHYLKNLKVDFKDITLRYNLQNEKNLSLQEVKRKLQKLMSKEVGIVRSQAGLKRAATELERLLKYLKFNLDGTEGYEVQNLIILAYLTVQSALIRKESRGAHYRSDFPLSKRKWEKHIIWQGREWEELELEFK